MQTTPSSSTSSITPEPFSNEFICNLIPTGFSSNRFELGQFLANYNNAIQLASENKKFSSYVVFQHKGN